MCLALPSLYLPFCFLYFHEHISLAFCFNIRI
nr:MAG TPA: hypothetical protein [Caudoviricetes sp.]